MAKIYCPCIMGQFGILFSGGVPIIASKLRALGIQAQVFGYKEASAIEVRCIAFRKAGYLLGAVGFSLGTSTLDYLQQHLPFELIMCLAESSLEVTFHINHRLCKRSVLWHGTDFLSNAGGTDGFDVTKQTSLPHLLIPYSSTIQQNVVDEFRALMKGK